MPLPDKITCEHILKAIQQINEKGIPNHYQSSFCCVVERINEGRIDRIGRR